MLAGAPGPLALIASPASQACARPAASGPAPFSGRREQRDCDLWTLLGRPVRRGARSSRVLFLITPEFPEGSVVSVAPGPGLLPLIRRCAGLLWFLGVPEGLSCLSLVFLD